MAKKVQPAKAQAKKAAPAKGKVVKATVPAKKAVPVQAKEKLVAVKGKAPAKKAAPAPAKVKVVAAKGKVPAKKAVPIPTKGKAVAFKGKVPAKKATPAVKAAPAIEKKVEKKVVTAKAPVKKAEPKKIEPKKEIKASMPSKPIKAEKPSIPQKELPKVIYSKDEIRGTLLKRREDLMKEIVGNRERESDPLKKDVGDIYDEASSERERELSLTLGDRDRQKLIEIDEALQRLESGEYGVCESCGEKIATGRLKAQPFARLCISCKSEEERQEARQKKFEAEGVYRTISYVEEEEG